MLHAHLLQRSSLMRAHWIYVLRGHVLRCGGEMLWGILLRCCTSLFSPQLLSLLSFPLLSSPSHALPGSSAAASLTQTEQHMLPQRRRPRLLSHRHRLQCSRHLLGSRLGKLLLEQPGTSAAAAMLSLQPALLPRLQARGTGLLRQLYDGRRVVELRTGHDGGGHF